MSSLPYQVQGKLIRFNLIGTPTVNVKTTPSTVQASGVKLQIYGTIGTAISTGASFQIIAPSELSLTVQTSLVPTCTVSGKIMTVSITGSVQAAPFQLDVSSCITNPLTTNPSSTFQFSTFKSGNLVESQTSGIQLTATVGTVTSFSLKSLSDIVGDSTSLQVTFTPAHNIPAGGIIKMTFPLWNPNAPASLQQDFFQSAISCDTIAILSSSLLCSYSSQTLTLTNGVQGQIASGSSVSFTIKVFTNPISTSSISGFGILIQDSSLGSIDSGTASLSISTPAQLKTPTFKVDSSTPSAVAGIVQEKNNMQLSFYLPVPLNPTCTIKIILPPQFDTSSTTQISIFGIFGSLQTLSSSDFIIDSSSNTITFTSCSTYADKAQPAVVTINNVQLPAYSKATSSIQIQVTGAGNAQIATLTSGLTYTPNPGSISIVSGKPDVIIVQTITTIQLIVKPKHGLSVNSEIIVTFPSAYSSVGGTCAISNTQIINSGASCSVSGTTFTLTNILLNPYDASSNLQFSISQIKLPQTTQSLSGFVVTTYIQDSTDLQYYKVDSVTTSIPFSLAPGSITASVTPSSFITSILSTYTVQFQVGHDIPQNGYVTIIYPSQISIPDTSYSASQTIATGFPSPSSFQITSSTRTIKINNGFRSSSASAGSTFSFQMPGVQNPLTQQRTNSFIISTFRQDGNLIDQVAGGVNVIMTQSAYIQSISITLESYVNAAVTDYTFSLTATVPIQSNNNILISFPAELTLPTKVDTLNCLPLDKTIISYLECAYTSRVTNGLQVKLYLASGLTQINELQTFGFKMSGITNPTSTQPSSTFAITITDPSYNTINSNENDITISTTTPFTIPSNQGRVYQENSQAGQLSDYSIAIYPSHTITAGGGIQITYPSQITLPGSLSVRVKLSSATSNPTISYDQSTRIIILKNAFSKNFVANPSTAYFNVTLSGFKNPLSNQQTDSFIIQTFNTDSSKTNFYYIDWMIQGLTLNSACNYPCKSCSADDPSFCLSCYTTGTLNKLQDNACVSSCSLGRFLNANTGVCEFCDSTCLSCVDQASKCATCGIGNYLYLYNDRCQVSCPDGYIANSKINQCQQCTSPCQTCQNTVSTCTSCIQSSSQPLFYAAKSSCYSSCPDQITVLQNNKCVDCDSSCKTCSGSPSYCTSCESYMKFDQQKHNCIQMCEKDTQIYNQLTGNCDYCSGSCATCSGTVNTCTSCPTNLVLNTNNTCAGSCNNVSQIAINGTCTSCQLPCSQCKEKTTHCTKCSGDYLLYNTTCVQYCPLKYEANNETGQCVLVGLICPAAFVINEAGDGCIPRQIECKKDYQVNKQFTACVPSPGFPIPFPFLILSICFGMIVVGSHIRDKFFTKVVTCLIALIGSQEMLIYLLMIAYSIQLQEYAPMVLSFVGAVMLFVANLSFFIYYKRDILKKDVTFYKWCRMYPRTAKFLPIAALFLNFKCIKMLYSGFFGQESCLVQFENPQKTFLRPLKFVTFFSFVFVYIPIFIADILIFSTIEWGYQLLVLAIESFILIITIVILTIIEFRSKDGLIMNGDEQYVRIKPKGFDGQSNVMSGLIDMDEKTLIRSRLDDDDYEVQLRKRALFSILDQVGKNFFNCQNQGVDLGGHIDHVLTKFDEEKLKLRRAFSLEEIKEEDSWVASGEEDEQSLDRYQREIDEDGEDDGRGQRRYSYPLTPRSMAQVQNPQFSQTLQEIKDHKKDSLLDNVYADCKPPDRQKEKKQKKQVSRRTQTYLRELLCLQGEDLLDSDLEIIMEDEAEIDQMFAKDLIDNVIDGLSDEEGNKKKGKKKKGLFGKRAKEIPDFELADIMGEFEIDDLGNFIILKGEKNELLDKRERRVNRRGYLVDRFGNVINNKGQVIFKAVELDSDDEIPAPFGFEKRKKNLLNMGEDNQFKVEENQGKKPGIIETDEEVIDRELKQVKKGKKKKKKGKTNDIVEEDDEEESSIDSLMADSPGKYQLNQDDANEDDIIDKVTRKKVPKKRGVKQSQTSNKKVTSSKIGQPGSPTTDSQRKRAQASPSGNAPPKRIKRDDTKEMFPSLAIENSEQRKLYKLAESIGTLAQQFADDQRPQLKSGGSQQQNNALSQERLEKLKQDHFRDIINSSQGPRGESSKDFIGQQPISFSNIGNRIMGDGNQQQRGQLKTSHNIDRKNLPPRNPLEKVYGNLGDVVGYEEKQILEQMKAAGITSFQSQLSSRMEKATGQSFGALVGDRRLKGLESIYLQKFDKKSGKALKKQVKPKFRQTLNQFVDDPEMLLDDGGMDFSKQNEVSLMVAEKLDKLQRQYMSNTSGIKFDGYIPSNQMAGQNSAGGNFGKKPGSVSGSIFNQESSLEPIKKGNWIERQN